MSDTEFRLAVMEALTELRTKMTALFGDGNGSPGRLQALEAKVAAHEQYIARQEGRSGAWDRVCGVLVPLLVALLTTAATLLATAIRMRRF
jgi:hypothetical protein